jgi:hypothetical protein
MRIYFADSQVPEMSSLSRDERYLIKSTTWKTVIQKTPWKRWIQIGVIGIGIVLGWLAGSLAVLMIDGQQKSGQINPTMPISFQIAASVFGALIGVFIAKQLVLRELRAQWRMEGSRY